MLQLAGVATRRSPPQILYRRDAVPPPRASSRLTLTPSPPTHLPAPRASRSSSLSLLTTSSNACLHTSTFPESDSLTDKYNWNPDAEVRVWPLDAEGALVGAVQRYEFRARAGDSVGFSRVSDETVDWSRPGDGEPAVEEVSGPDGIDVVPGDGALGFGSGVRDLDLVGPFQVAVANGASESSSCRRDYLLSLRVVGLKSVECVRLLTLHHNAFPMQRGLRSWIRWAGLFVF